MGRLLYKIQLLKEIHSINIEGSVYFRKQSCEINLDGGKIM